MEHLITPPKISCKNWASQYVEESQALYCWDTAKLHNFTPAVFDTESMDIEKKRMPAVSGRGKIKRFVLNSENFVLRHFHRGGWVRYISNDLYMLPFSRRTRVEGEVNILLELVEKNLPVPEPAGFKIQRVGLFCRMDIILQEIVNAQNLVEVLCTRAIAPLVWRDIGRTICEFHRAKLCHADLNAHNILLDENNRIWLVDFDKSYFMNSFRGFWQRQNLARLQRSLLKEKARHTNFYLDGDAWSMLEQGYQGL